jgi:hypothetical protein
MADELSESERQYLDAVQTRGDTQKEIWPPLGIVGKVLAARSTISRKLER